LVAVRETILVLEDDHDMRSALADVLSELVGADVLPLGSFAELTAHRTAVLRCRLALVDINLGTGQPSGLDAFTWLREQHFGGRIAFLTGHAHSHPLVARALSLGTAAVIEKPVDVARLLAVVREAPPP
jgi:DNA-binding NtrC family response regulator